MGNSSVAETATFSIRHFPRSEIMEKPLPMDSFWKVIGRFLFSKRKKKTELNKRDHVKICLSSSVLLFIELNRRFVKIGWQQIRGSNLELLSGSNSSRPINGITEDSFIQG